MYIMLGTNNPQYVLQETGFASICDQKAHPVFYWHGKVPTTSRITVHRLVDNDTGGH